MSAVWPRVKLGDVLRSVPRAVHVKADVLYREIGIRSHGKGVFHKNPVSGLELGSKKVFWVEPGDFVLNIVFAWEGAVVVLSEAEAGMIGSHRFPTFRADEARLDCHFLLAYFRTPEGLDLLGRVSPGGAGRNRTLSRTAFLQQHIPLPPLSVQRYVVETVEGIAAHVTDAQLLRKQAAEETEALLASKITAVFTRGVASGWRSTCLGEFVLDDCYGTSEKTTDDRTGVSILRMGNIQDGRLVLNNLKYLHLSEKDRARLLLKRGDILVNRTNSAELVGKCAVFDLEGEYAFASYLIRVRPDVTRVEPRLIAAYINSPMGRKYMMSEKKQMTGQANVNAGRIRALPIALPALPEQQRTITELNELQGEVDKLRRLQAETSTELNAFLPAVLAKAFAGAL